MLICNIPINSMNVESFGAANGTVAGAQKEAPNAKTEFRSKIKVDGNIDDWLGGADERIWTDDAGDEAHKYPDDTRWEKGSLDLVEFRVCEDEDNLNFLVRSGSIDNTINYPNGFSEQVIEILIDKCIGEGSGRTDTIANAKLSLDELEAWRYAVVVNGKRGTLTDVFENSWEISVKGSSRTNCIEIAVQESMLGNINLRNWSFTVLVGAYDDENGFLDTPRDEIIEVPGESYAADAGENVGSNALVAHLIEKEADNVSACLVNSQNLTDNEENSTEQLSPAQNVVLRSDDSNSTPEPTKINPPPKKSDFSNVYDRITARSVTGVKIVYDSKYNTRNYTCWTSGTPSYSKWNGTMYNDLNVVKNAGVIRRNTIFNVTANDISSADKITVKGPCDIGESRPTIATWNPQYDSNGPYWNFTVPTDAPVGDYQVYINDTYCTVYVIFDVALTQSAMNATEFSSWAYNETKNNATNYTVGQYSGAGLLMYGWPYEERQTELACSVMGKDTTTPFIAATKLYRAINARVSWTGGTGASTNLTRLLNNNGASGLTLSEAKKIAQQTGETLPGDMVVGNAQCTHFCTMMSTWPRSMGIPARAVADSSTSDLYSNYWGWHNWAEVYIKDPDMTLSSTDGKWLVFDASDQYTTLSYNSNQGSSIDSTHNCIFAVNRLDRYSSEAISYWVWDGVNVPSSSANWDAIAETGNYSYGISDLPTITPGNIAVGWLGAGDRDFFRIDATGQTSIDLGFLEGAQYAQIYVNNTTTGTNVPSFSPANAADLKTAYNASLFWGDDRILSVGIPASVTYVYVMVDNAKEFKYANDYAKDGTYANYTGMAELHRWVIGVEPLPPNVTVKSPNGNDVLICGRPYNITWNVTIVNSSRVASTPINLSYSTDGGSIWTSIATSQTNTGYYIWNVPPLDSTSCRINVSCYTTDGKTGWDTSDKNFTIRNETAFSTLVSGDGSASSQFGWNVTCADVNGDSYDDIIVGAPYAAAGGTARGSVYIFFGYSTINTGNLNAANADVTISGTADNAHFGWSLGHGKFDETSGGYEDLIIGEPDNGTGVAYIFLGRSSWSSTYTTGNANVTLAGTGAGDKFGFSVSGAGDVNNDGYGDVILGAYANSSNKGKAYIYYGRAGWVATTVNITLTGENTNDNFGYSVSSAGDVNNDNYDDVIVGAPGYDNSRGKAYIYKYKSATAGMTTYNFSSNFGIDKWFYWNGSGNQNPPTWGPDGPSDVELTNYSAIAYSDNTRTSAADGINGYAGQVNLHHFKFILSEPFATITQINITWEGYDTGSAQWLYIWNLSSASWQNVSTGSSKTADNVISYQSSLVSNYVNSSTNRIDFIITAKDGSSATNYYFYTDYVSINVTHTAYETGASFATRTGEVSNDNFGFSVSALGDINNDSYSDVAVGAPGYNESNGRVYVYCGNPCMASTDNVIITQHLGDKGDGWVGKDAFIRETTSVSNYSYGSFSNLYIGSLAASGRARGLIQFDLSFIPQDTIVLNASLKLSVFAPPANSMATSVHQVLHSWKEGAGGQQVLNSATINSVTWVERWYGDNINNGNTPFDDTDPDWQSPGMGEDTDYVKSAEANITIASTAWYSWYITSLVQEWVNGSATNYGLAIIGWGGTTDYLRFYSAEFTDNRRAPTLVLTTRKEIADIVITGDKAGDQFGYSICGKDLNKDSISDIIIGAPYNDNSTTDGGAVYTFYGNATIMPSATNASHADNTTFGTVTNGYLGCSLSAGNIDNGDFDQSVVGAFGNNSNAGKVYVLTSASLAPNNPPSLSNGAVTPTSGTTSTTFTYNVTYSDTNGDPLTSIVVYILNGGANITGSPFAMAWQSGSNTTGANYAYSTTLPAAGTEYTSYFNATDGTDNATPTASIDAPDLTTPISVLVNLPNGAEIWNNTNHWINYTISGGAAPYTIKLYYSTTGSGGAWTFIAFHNQSAGGTFNYTWFTPTADSTNCYVNVSVNDSATLGYDLSDSNFTIDSTPPTSSVDVISPYWRTSYTITITVSNAADSLSGIARVRLYYRNSTDNISWGSWTYYGYTTNPPYQFNFNAANYGGDRFFEFYSCAVDNASNIEAAPAARDTLAATDTTKSTSNVSAISPYLQTTSPLTITVTASDENATGAESGLATVELWVRNSTDNATWSSWWLFGTDADPWASVSWSFNFPNGTGYYEFYSIAKDNATNTEAAPLSNDTLCRFQPVTNQLPNPPTLTAPNNNTWTNDSTPYFDWDFSDPDGGDTQGGFHVQINSTNDFGVPSYDYNSSTNTSTFWDFPIGTGYTTISDGTWYWRVKTKDNNGAWGEWSGWNITKIDTALPTSTISTPSTDPARYNTTSIWLNGTCSDSLSGVNKVEINITWKDNGTTYLAWTNATLAANYTWWNYSFTPPNEANFTIYIRAVDNASNYQVAITTNVTYDATAPTVTSVSPTVGATNIAITTTITKTFNESMNQTSVNASFKVYQDGSATPLSGSYSWSGNQSIFTPSSSLSPNTKYWGNASTGAKDLAGNPLGAANNTWFITAAGVSAGVNSPNGFEIWKNNTNYWINYTISGGAAPYTIKLYYSTTGSGGAWTFIAFHNQSTAGTFNYTWLTPTADSTNCYVNVTVNDSTTLGYDLSDSNFTIDSTAPTSSVNTISPYWQIASPLTVTATASDGASGLASVELWHRYSTDNSTWGGWSLFGTATVSPWSWSFTFPNGTGYYEFYSRARDNATNYEAAPGSRDALCGYDNASPTSNVNIISSYWQTTSPLTITGTASETGPSGLASVELWYRYASDNATWGGWVLSSTDNDPWVAISWSFTFLNGTGYYEFYNRARDNATNYEVAPGTADTICGYDNAAPTSFANAISPYVQTSSPITITATASDTGYSGLASVELWHRYSTDNSSWGGWTLFGTDTASPWSWNFNFPNGTGYYEFYSRARDNATNYEVAPATNDTLCRFAPITPVTFVNTMSPYWQTVSPLAITATASADTNAVELWARNSTNNVTFSIWWLFNNKTASPWQWSFNFPNGTGYYEFYSRGWNITAGWEVAPGTADAICGYDNATPTSSANTISPYVQTTTPLTTTATASDGTSGLANVELWHRYSTDNSSWGGWTLFGTDTATPWSWSFNFPNGTGYYEFYTRARDNATNYESAPASKDALCQYLPGVIPSSSVDSISPYWQSSSPLAITATASPSANAVELWYRYSTDNSTWGGWILFSNDTALPWQWSFTFSNGTGYYEFYSVGWNASAEYESAPGTADTICGYDNAAPTSNVNIISPYWQITSPLTITATASDTEYSGLADVELWHRYSTDNSTWGGWVLFGTDTASPWSWSFSFPNGTGYYQFYSRARDNATNYEVVPGSADTICGYDITPPNNPTSNTSDPQINIWINDTTIYVGWVGASDALSGIACYYYAWTTTTAYTPTTSDNFTVLTSNTSLPLSDNASWYLHVRAKDNATNLGTGAYHIGPFKIDTIPPVTGILLIGTLGENSWYISNVIINLTATDGGSGVDYTMYKIGDLNWNLYTGNISMYTEGTKTFYYYSVDKAGNAEAVNNTAIKIDKSLPAISHIPLKSPQRAGPYNVTAEITDLPSGVNDSWVKINATIMPRVGDWQNVTVNMTRIPGTSTYYYNLSQNTSLISPENRDRIRVIYYIQAKDDAGNIRNTPTYTFIIDLTPVTEDDITFSHYNARAGQNITIYVTIYKNETTPDGVVFRVIVRNPAGTEIYNQTKTINRNSSYVVEAYDIVTGGGTEITDITGQKYLAATYTVIVKNATAPEKEIDNQTATFTIVTAMPPPEPATSFEFNLWLVIVAIVALFLFPKRRKK